MSLFVNLIKVKRKPHNFCHQNDGQKITEHLSRVKSCQLLGVSEIDSFCIT